jgi:hypothetical protein
MFVKSPRQIRIEGLLSSQNVKGSYRKWQQILCHTLSVLSWERAREKGKKESQGGREREREGEKVKHKQRKKGIGGKSPHAQSYMAAVRAPLSYKEFYSRATMLN